MYLDALEERNKNKYENAIWNATSLSKGVEIAVENDGKQTKIDCSIFSILCANLNCLDLSIKL